MLLAVDVRNVKLLIGLDGRLRPLRLRCYAILELNEEVAGLHTRSTSST